MAITNPQNTQGQSIKTGVIAPQAAKNAVGRKTYFHRANGARFILPDGSEVIFVGGEYSTDDPDIKQELDLVANKPASQIYTQREQAATKDETLEKIDPANIKT